MNHARVLLVSVLVVFLMLSVVKPVRGETILYRAVLEGVQEVPPNASPADGTALLYFDEVTKVLTYSVTFSGLVGTETAAHIHGPAPPGVNAAVLFPLAPGNPKIGSVVLTLTQEGYLRDGLLYVNIHSQVYPGGEIRGQVLLAAVGGELMPVSVVELLAPYIVVAALAVVGVVAVLRGRGLKIPLSRFR